MSAGSTETRAPRAAAGALAALAGLSLAGCPTAKLDLRPFAVDVRVAGAATSLAEGLSAPAFISLSGTAAVRSPTELSVADATFGDVRITFSNDGAPEIVFPARLEGQTVFVTAEADPAGRLPGGAPLPFPGLRVATGAADDQRSQFLLGESTLPSGQDTAAVPLALVNLGADDFPVFFVQVNWLDSEPADCGVRYFDLLGVSTPAFVEFFYLGDGERLTELTVGAFEGAWTVRHVQSWHRTGDCPGDAPAYTQFAAWR